MIIDSGLLVIDLYILWNAICKGFMIAVPVWLCYIVLKIKVLDWKEYW